MKKTFIIIFSGLFLVLILLSSLYIFSFRLNGSNRIEILYNDDYKDLGYKTFLFLSKLVKTKDNVNTGKIGTYYVTYKLPFKTLVREVKVVDKESPILTLIGEDNVEINVGSKYQELGVNVNDNVDLDLSSKVIIDSNLDTNILGIYQIRYIVEDNSHNKSEIVRNIKVVDKVAPVISLKGSSKVIVNLNSIYEEEGYVANDNVDGDLTEKVNVENNVDYSKVGSYFIKYSCRDSSSNFTEALRTVEVTENIGITYIKGILLVNKKYHLPANYNPGYNNEAYSNLQRLIEDGKANGYSIPIISGFRSYQTQKNIFNNYVSVYGYETANTFSALPGQSEHQTGLAFDVGEISDNYGDTPAGIWLRENAHKYGFIIRYLKGKESITGYKYEPWHIRYVGSVAKEIYQNNLTLEEYLGVV